MFRPARLLAATVALTLVPAAVAIAHPGFDPNRVPVGEQVDAELIIAHGCTMAATDAEAATVRVDLGTTDQVRVEPVEVDGWDVVDDGEAIVWTDAGGATHEAFRLPVVLTVTHGAEGDEVHLPVFQECAGGDTYRWVAEPGEDGDPALRLLLTGGALGTDPIEDDHGDGEDPTDEAAPDQHGTEHPEETDGATPPDADDADDIAAGNDAAVGAGAGMLIALLVVLALLAVSAAVILAGRRPEGP